MLQSLPYKDFTIKARLAHAEETENILIKMNAKFIGLDLQTDHYFETSVGRLKWREATIENLITHYERLANSDLERTIVYRYDLHPTQAQIDELFQNHKKIGTTKKERKIYLIDNVKIHIDKLSNDEEFIEIEAIDRDNLFTEDELRNQCLDIKTILKISDHDLIPTGYLKDETKIIIHRNRR